MRDCFTKGTTMSKVEFDQGFNSDPLPHQLPENRGRYSIGRAIACLSVSGNLDGLEGEVSCELGKRYDRNIPLNGCPGANGFFVPWDVECRSLNQTTGAGAITTVLPRPIIDVLRAKLVVGQLGASVFPDLSGGMMAIPTKTATVSLTYTGDGQAAPAQSSPTFGYQAALNPSTVGAYCDISRKFWKLVPDSDALVIDDITSAIAVDIDRAALNGYGNATGDPILGILQDPSHLQFDVTGYSNLLSHGAFCDMECLLGNANADLGPLGFVTSPNGRSKLRSTDASLSSGGSGRYVWRPDNTLSIGCRALATTNVPSNLTHGSTTNTTTGVLGYWPDLVVGLWGPMTIIVNPFMQSVSGVIRVTGLVDYGTTVRHAQSFCCAAGFTAP